MNSRTAMTMRAKVERGTSTVDAGGLPGPKTWATLHASLACRLWTQGEREIVDGGKTLVSADHRAMIPKGTTIDEADRITLISDRAGGTLVGNTLEVRSVIRRKDHIELRLQEYS